MAFTRKEVTRRLRSRIKEGVPIIGGGAGNGISGKCQEAGGVDLLIIYNSGRFRMNGRGSLAGCMPYGDANGIVMEMAGEVLTIVKDTPVLAGVCGTDPTRLMDVFLREVKEAGFSGVQNFPTVGLCDGQFRANLEETGMGYGLEVEMVREAHKQDLFTTPYAFDTKEAEAMADAGADVVVAHMGLTTKGGIGAETSKTLDDSVKDVQAIADAAMGVNSDVIVLCHGGPISMPEDAEFVLQRVKNVHGFYGASSVERLPTEVAIKDQMAKFKAIRFK
jgi:predicted TIM-barrel enzyme